MVVVHEGTKTIIDVNECNLYLIPNAIEDIEGVLSDDKSVNIAELITLLPLGISAVYDPEAVGLQKVPVIMRDAINSLWEKVNASNSLS